MKEESFSINKLIESFLKNNIGDYNLKNNNLIKFRYEYILNNNNKNIFIYLNNWNQLINLYRLIPDDKKHFYEIIDDKCKFFLDMDAKCDEIKYEDWELSIIIIKQKLIDFFNNYFNKNIKILEYQSYPTKTETKRSCHLIIPNYCFYADDCKNLFRLFIDSVDLKYRSLIDDKVYGNRRMLRIEGSTKLNSNRKKIYLNNNYEDNQNILLEGLITNIKDIQLLYTKIYIPDLNKEIKYKPKKEIVLRYDNKKYNNINSDLQIISYEYKYIINIINKWHYDYIKHSQLNDIFIFNYIINNMIILKRIKAFMCPDCNRIHENQHPYVFVVSNNLYFHCRRSSKPIKTNIKIHQ